MATVSAVQTFVPYAPIKLGYCQYLGHQIDKTWQKEKNVFFAKLALCILTIGGYGLYRMIQVRHKFKEKDPSQLNYLEKRAYKIGRGIVKAKDGDVHYNQGARIQLQDGDLFLELPYKTAEIFYGKAYADIPSRKLVGRILLAAKEEIKDNFIDLLEGYRSRIIPFSFADRITRITHPFINDGKNDKREFMSVLFQNEDQALGFRTTIVKDPSKIVLHKEPGLNLIGDKATCNMLYHISATGIR